ncbi:MAG TPA: hypothetical protein P5232_02540 [Candidatus Moranbacteria bacterium]|nr:hypothetical protein [Candidatus Moranbacteria bacterium]
MKKIILVVVLLSMFLLVGCSDNPQERNMQGMSVMLAGIMVNIWLGIMATHNYSRELKKLLIFLCKKNGASEKDIKEILKK